MKLAQKSLLLALAGKVSSKMVSWVFIGIYDIGAQRYLLESDPAFFILDSHPGSKISVEKANLFLFFCT